MPSLPARFQQPADVGIEAQQRSLELWSRMLFSCLIDADRLATEAFCNRADAARRGLQHSSVAELRQQLDRHLDSLQAANRPSAVNEMRRQVLSACRKAGEQDPGIFSLTVPTGGGKTLSGMAFALRHAEQHGLRRVVVAIPFTSIIEQNAAVYRAVFGVDNVIEHHSNLDPEQETEQNKFASENWDAPVIVTTNVQLFESLLSNRTSRCRKLHNLARSVLILDEVQTLPAGLLHAIVEILGELSANYGSSVVLSTATQPALDQQVLSVGFDDVREIAPNPTTLFARSRRVAVDWTTHTDRSVSWRKLANLLAGEERVLAIVHRRQDARALAELLPEEGRFHLSASMCADHRKETLKRIEARLKEVGPCRVVSTQLVEAGVDLDFPVVYRALGGLDSVAQAAGRCNREGELEKGKVVVFRAPTSPPPGTPVKAMQTTESLLAERNGELDICDPTLFSQFFRQLYAKEPLDIHGLQVARSKLRFATVARKAKLIDDGFLHPVVVHWGAATERVEVLRRMEKPTKELLRGVQPFLVNVYEKEFQRLTECGALEAIPIGAPVVQVLAVPFEELYHHTWGLLSVDDFEPDVEVFIA